MKGKNRSDQEGILEPDGWVEIQDVSNLLFKGYRMRRILPFSYCSILSRFKSLGGIVNWPPLF